MGREIHVTRFDGVPHYRLWSTIVDAYITTPTSNLAAFKQLLLEGEIERTCREFESDFPKRVERALKFGTSSFVHARYRRDDWDLSMDERVAAGEFAEEEEETS